MSIRMLVVALAAIFSLCLAGAAQAHDGGSWEHKNHYLRQKMKSLGGDPGCDLVAKKCKRIKKVTGKKVRRYFNTMRQAIMPRRAVHYVHYGSPRQAPAGTENVNAGSTLETIAQCESGGDPTAVNPNGHYGKYQFDLQTWASVGGSGNPAAASEAEQNKRAAILYSQRGGQPWACAR